MVFCQDCKYCIGSWKKDKVCHHPKVMRIEVPDWYHKRSVYGVCQELNTNNNCELYDRWVDERLP